MASLSNVLQYKGYRAQIQYSVEDGVLHGKIEGIRDLVCFEAEKAADIESEFHHAVDDYLEMCAEMGVEPDKAYSGSFNVRVSSELHRAAAMMAIDKGTTLNQVVESALKTYVSEKPPMEVKITVAYTPEVADSMASMFNGGGTITLPQGVLQ